MKYRPPLNNVLVRVETIYIKNITDVLKMAAIQQHSSVDPADYVNIVGTVVATPLKISQRKGYEGYSADDIKVGDVAIFSSSVISETVQTDPEADPIFKNSFWWDGQEYFTVDITRLYAVVRDGEIRMQNGYVMLENIEEEKSIYLPNHIKKTINTIQATLTNVGHKSNIGCKEGDNILINPNRITRYQVNNKKLVM